MIGQRLFGLRNALLKAPTYINGINLRFTLAQLCHSTGAAFLISGYDFPYLNRTNSSIPLQTRVGYLDTLQLVGLCLQPP